MGFYERLAATALKLLTKYGATVTFVRGGGTFVGSTGIRSGAETTFTGFGAMFNYTSAELGGEGVQAGDMKLLCNAMTTAPQIDDTVTLNGLEYRVMSVTETNPAGVPVMYSVRVRR